MGVNPTDRFSIDDSPASWAIWWAGPMIGLLNLIPVLPLDGGHIVLTGLDRLVGKRSRLWMLYFSLAVTGVRNCRISASRTGSSRKLPLGRPKGFPIKASTVRAAR